MTFTAIQCCLIVFAIVQNQDRRRQWHPTPVLLPGKSHRWKRLVGCSSWGCYESDTTQRLHYHFSLSCIGEGNGNPFQCSCLENPRDGGALQAAVYGVAQSRTRLKRLSSRMWQVLQQRYKQGTLGTRSLHVSRSFPSQPRILSALPLRSRLSSLRESGPTGLSAKPPISFSAFIFYFSPRNVSSLVTITIILSTREQWFKVYKALSHPFFHLITSSSTFLEPILGISLV